MQGLARKSERSVFLTHQIEQVDKPAIHKLFADLMFSVEPLYDRTKRNRFVNAREALFARNRVALDSGGFGFLLGRMKQVPSPHETVEVYKSFGYRPGDFLMQLDLPPSYSMPREERMDLILKSASYYHEMRTELGGNVLPVVHGWTAQEISTSLDVLTDPDKTATPSYLTANKVYAVGSFATGGKPRRKAPGKERVAVGSFLSVSGKPNVMKSLKTPSKKVAVGSYVAKIPLKETVATPGAEADHVIMKVPREVIYDRLVTAFQVLKDKEIFCLGGSSINTLHMIFLLGAKYIDGASWRLAARMWRIYIPELGEYCVGTKRTAKRLDDKAVGVMRKWYTSSPLRDIPFSEFLEKLPGHGAECSDMRAVWNAYVVKVEERIANDYATNPDAYVEYLRRRWENSAWWTTILNFVWRRVKSPYVQEDLTVYLKKGVA
jgi:hypothetical protein